MRENIDVFDFELTDDEMARIAAMDPGESLFFDHREARMVEQPSRRSARSHATDSRSGARRYGVTCARRTE
jgi:hypothetical protein